MAELTAELSRVWESHRPEIDARVATIELAVSELNAGTLGEESRAAAGRAAHQLAGTCGTFGFGRASVHAAELQQRLAGGHAQIDEAPRLTQLVLDLRAALPQAA